MLHLACCIYLFLPKSLAQLQYIFLDRVSWIKCTTLTFFWKRWIFLTFLSSLPPPTGNVLITGQSCRTRGVPIECATSGKDKLAASDWVCLSSFPFPLLTPLRRRLSFKIGMIFKYKPDNCSIPLQDSESFLSGEKININVEPGFFKSYPNKQKDAWHFFASLIFFCVFFFP